MAGLEIRLLGSFEVNSGGKNVAVFESNKVRGLLAYLAVEGDRVHNREKLAALFWPEMGTDRAGPNLSRALYNLRQVIQDHQADPPYLLRSRSAIQLNLESDIWIDFQHFMAGLDKVQTLDPRFLVADEGELARVESAIDLYRGEFLEGLVFQSSLAFDEWSLVIRQRVQRRFLSGLHLLTETYAGQGEFDKALIFARKQVEIDPLNEPASRQLMRLLAANGQRNQALVQYEHLQVILAEELQVRPDAETRRLIDGIKGVGSQTEETLEIKNNLPAFLSPLIGRRSELAEVRERLLNPSCRLLTILGPGGSGKTRLALEVARSNLNTFRDGVFFVPLNPVQSLDSMLPAITEVLDLPRSERENHQEQLTNYLRNKSLLLVLDGFEHLLDCADILAVLLRQAAGLKILVTSRAGLNIKSEQRYLLYGMCLPGETGSDEDILGSDAVQLLLSGLRQGLRDYQPEPDDLIYLVQICRQVEGMPLGILLAASWGKTFSVPEIATRVARSLDFLAADWTDVPARQRSLRATFDYTWNLLGESEQRIFKSLSVFRGAFTRQAARYVSGSTHHELRSMVAGSLMLNETPGWYIFHELMRQYGREKLARSPQDEKDVCDRHSEYYLDQLVGLGQQLKTDGQQAAISSIDLEHENYRAAWNWAAGQGATIQLSPVVDALCLYYDLSTRYPDGERACKAALDGLPQPTTNGRFELFRAHTITWQSRFTRLSGLPEAADRLMESAGTCLKAAKEASCQVNEIEAFHLLEQGNTYFNKDRTVAAACYQDSLALFQDLGDSWGAANVLRRLGILAHNAGSFQEAVDFYRECLALYRETGDPRGIANALGGLGHNLLRQGQVGAGIKHIEEAALIRGQIGDRAGAALNILDLGRYCFYSGQFSKGNALWLRVFPILEDLGMRSALVYSTTALSVGLSHNGEYAEAIAQVKKGLKLAEEVDARHEIGMGYMFLGIAYLGLGYFERAQDWTQKSITLYQEIDQRDEMAWALALLVFVERKFGRVSTAESYLHQTLEIGIQTRGYFPVLCGLCGAALLAIDQGEVEKAVEFAALVFCFPVAANSQWFEDVAGREIAAAAETLTPDVVATAQERGRSRDLWDTAKELLEELSEEMGDRG